MCFEKIRNKYHRGILSFLTQDSTLKREDREDLAQEVLIKIYRNMDSFDREKSPGPWVYTICRRTLTDFKRKKENQIALCEFQEEAHFILSPSGPQEQLEKKEDLEKLHRILRHLPSPSRQILFLVYWEGMTCRETGRIMGIPAGTVKYKLFAMRKTIRSLWNEEEK